ncbi:MAG: hypothetical protein OXU79_11140 [Gemmatimonadota bacterium]|nr:hypothetical protein [Gemmatimonadota bacterium]
MKTTNIKRIVYVLIPFPAALCAVLLLVGVAKPAYAQVLVSNTDQTRTGNYNALFNDFAQEFTTGSNIDGYRLTSIEVIFENSISAPNVKPSVKINLSNNGVPGGTALGELTKSGGLVGGLNQFEAPSGGIDLEADTSYVVWFDNSPNVQFAIQNPNRSNNFLYTTSDAEDSGASAGWSMGNNMKVKRRVRLVIGRGWQPDTDATWTSFNGLLMISVDGSVLNSYDNDGDGLIEIGSLAQLNAVRWDLDGDGAVDDNANAAAYADAFPNAVAGMGCPTTADDADDNDCIGYELTADMDFDTNGDGTVDAADSYWNGGAGWLPIGSSGSGNEFVATFEGNRHTIDNLYIYRSISAVGLFGVVGADGHVRNAGLREINLNGGDGSVVGGFAGINRGGISGSYAEGLAQTGESGSVGVLLGANTGIVSSSYASGKLYCENGSNAGGLVGLHGGSGGRSIITASYATSLVSGSDGSDLGGLAGQVAVVGSGARCIIIASYATGAVAGDGNVGGLVGQTAALGNDCKAIITASYATGEVEGVDSNVGGLVGHNLSGGPGSGGTITASYATGTVTGSGQGNFGGLVGKDSTNLNSINNVSYSYWNTETSGQISSDGGIGKTTIELVTPTGYAGIYASWNLDLDDDNTRDDPWEFGNSNEYPMLRADFDGDGDNDAEDVDPQRRVVSSPAVSTDFNGDGTTDFVDFFLFADAFGSSDSRYDLNGDGTVDFIDFFRFVDAFRT